MEFSTLLNTGIKLCQFLAAPVLHLGRALKNWWHRPKLHISIEPKNFIFIDNNDIEHHLTYFCLIIKNISKHSLNINLGKLRVNIEMYSVIAQGDPLFLRLNSPALNGWKQCNSDVYKLLKENWLNTSQGLFTIDILSHRSLIFPMRLIENTHHAITSRNKNSILLFPNSKISITLEINNNIYEYGINRTNIYEKYINYILGNKK